MILNTRKTISVFLAVTLIFTLFAATTYAAPADGYALKLTLELDKPNAQPGDLVTLSVMYDSAPEFAGWGGGQFLIGFPHNVIDLHPDGIAGYEGGKNIIDANVVTIPEGSPLADDIVVAMASAMDEHNRPLDEVESTYGWTKQRRLTIATDIGVSLLHDFSTKKEAFQINLKVADVCEPGTYYIGFVKEAYKNPSFECISGVDYVDYMTGVYNNVGMSSMVGVEEGFVYDLSEAVVAITVGDTATDPVVTSEGVKVQWDNDDAHIKLGYRATISDLELTTTYNAEADAYEVNELSEVGVIFSTTIENPTLADVDGGTALKAICNTLYDNKDGTYSFRAVVKGAPIDNTTTINSVMYITLADGTTSYYSISGTTTPKAAFDAGRANGMPDFGV